jgi:cyclopropane fatty-acyl-phospholipid synthase-like methyltransferase
MGFYDDKKTALQYIEMAEGYDGRELIEVLRNHLPDGASVLELGMGPGVDLKILSEYFRATGSDNSQFFLDRYRNSHSRADLIYLDAVVLDTKRSFDCIFSNKVLHHLTNEELLASFSRQKEILSAPGLIMHSFWRGTGTEEHHGLRFVYQTEESIRSIVSQWFSDVEVIVYTEMEKDDSLYVVATL